MLRELTSALKRRLSPTLRAMARSGYLNSELQRTNEGIHLILNFIEAKFEDEFVAFLKAYVDEKEAEAEANAKSCN